MIRGRECSEINGETRGCLHWTANGLTANTTITTITKGGHEETRSERGLWRRATRGTNEANG